MLRLKAGGPPVINAGREVERGGRSLGIARHWQPVDKTYKSAFMTSRRFTVRWSPPRFAAWGVSQALANPGLHRG